ncbi:MAG TPA: HutD family protein [Gemmatimonadaceae bacterium]|jgi:hypothetical protein|nr:HutD family protein [Gemmatimonadaceae bacterium]
MVAFEREQLASTAWKNGGGRTREILRLPAGSTIDSFDWRASIADMTASGPFSTFVGFDRVIVLLSGAGARLQSSDGAIDHRLDEPLTPYSFAGESAIDASLIAGASTDFNVMTRRAATRADVQIVVADETLPGCSAGLLFAARGTWLVRSSGRASSSFSLAANAGLWWDGESLTWRLEPTAADAALISVRVLRRPPY